MELKRVVVTGIGAITPLGQTIEEYWNGLINGVSSADFITRFDASKFKTRFACEVKDFKPEEYIDRKEARRMDLFTQYALVAACKAMDISGLDTEKLDLDSCGVIWASGIGGIKTFEDVMKAYLDGDGTPKFNPFFIILCEVTLSKSISYSLQM